MQAEIDQYPPPIQELISPLVELRFDYAPNPLTTTREALMALRTEDLGESLLDENLAKCCLSGLWLLHGFLHESHEISQSISTQEGSYWHGIMHRAEADFWNSKYWFRKVQSHPVARQMAKSGCSAEDLSDLCEQANQEASTRSQATKFIRQEWALLFNYCWTNGFSSQVSNTN